MGQDLWRLLVDWQAPAHQTWTEWVRPVFKPCTTNVDPIFVVTCCLQPSIDTLIKRRSSYNVIRCYSIWRHHLALQYNSGCVLSPHKMHYLLETTCAHFSLHKGLIKPEIYGVKCAYFLLVFSLFIGTFIRWLFSICY